MTRIVLFMIPSKLIGMGAWIRDLRQSSDKTLREVAAAAGMDPALLSKIEHGYRLPTPKQVEGLARHFGVSESDMQAQRIAVEFLTRYGDSSVVQHAIAVINKAIMQSRSGSVIQSDK
jgi:transcriptional regulator with XRE-family HTH domain